MDCWRTTLLGELYGPTKEDALQYGEATFYGQQQAQDSYADCSLSENYANVNHLPWTNGISTTLALNGIQFADSAACGLCIMYRGRGGGLGTTPVPTTAWAMGFVNNRCGECAHGDIDQDLNGDGRYNVDWYAVPCNVGDSKLSYKTITKSHWIWAFVVANHRIPITYVSILINKTWFQLRRTTTNWFAYYREVGDWEGNFPMRVRITSANGETLEDIITTEDGGNGTVQFAPIPGPAYVSGFRSGHGVPELNTPKFASPAGAVPNIGPIAGASAHGTSTIPTTPNIPATAFGTDGTGTAFATPTIVVPDGQQCGGMKGACTARDRGQPAQPCIPAAWPNAVCATPGSWCQPTDTTGGMFTCQPAGAVSASNAVVVEWGGVSAFPGEAACGPTNCKRSLGGSLAAQQAPAPAALAAGSAVAASSGLAG
ncbi:hypothetical protein WJX81_007870 [Elliptochloris bilobata]|uniref:Expansin-like EG45 domain-containing protein n=1 Tax=Elliptochloris bilobata TaxID=381761 RepID=A0AAW1QMN5_9CHLO